jgi:hypothetical protein
MSVQSIVPNAPTKFVVVKNAPCTFAFEKEEDGIIVPVGVTCVKSGFAVYLLFY